MNEDAAEVLLIEDNPDDVAFFKHSFAKAKFANRVRVVSDGEEALNFLLPSGSTAGSSPKQPRVIFLDLKMPNVDGLEVLRQLKADPRTQSIPVVAFSSSQEERDLVEVYKIGANSYVVKPMDFEHFAETVFVLAQYWLRFNKTPNS